MFFSVVLAAVSLAWHILAALNSAAQTLNSIHMNCRTFIVIFSLLAMFSGRPAYSCSERPPSSFVEFSQEMDHILVMQTRKSDSRHRSPGVSGKYRLPGLYRLDGSSNPLWTIDWFSSTVFPHEGGRYLVQLDDRFELQQPSEDELSLNDLEEKLFNEKPDLWFKRMKERRHAISFYDAGELLHTYRLGDLFNDPEKIELVGTCLWVKWMTDYAFDQDAKVFKLATTENLSYSFSIVTGEILQVERYSKRKFTKIKNIARRKQLLKRDSDLPNETLSALLELIDRDWTTVAALGQPYLGDYALAKQIIGVHGETYRYFDARLRDKRDLSLLAVTSGEAISITHLDKHANDRKLLIAAVRYDGRNYNDLPDTLKSDKRLLLRALRHGGLYTYSGAPEHLRDDRDVIVAALRAQLRLFGADRMRSSHFRIRFLHLIPEEYLDDNRVRHLMDAVIEVYSVSMAEQMADKYREEVYSGIRVSTDR